MAHFLLRLGALGAAAALTASACSTGSDCDFGECPGVPVGRMTAIGPDGGMVNVVIDTPPPPGCNANADPASKEAAPCIDDAFALFVDPAGTATADGSRAHPLGTIGAAVNRVASSGKRRIYVCGASTFAEHLQLSAANAASIHGGFACGTWTVDAESRPRIAPADAGYAVQAVGVAAARALVLSDIEVASADVSAANDGSSSIAMFLNASTVTVLRVSVHASRPARGVSATPAAAGILTGVKLNQIPTVAPFSSAGDPAASGRPGAEKFCSCDTSPVPTSGGSGGNGGPGGQGTPKYTPPESAGAGGSGAPGCTTGRDGVAGANGTAAERLNTRGTLTSDAGWRPASGAAATMNGTIGGGGGGGGSGAGGEYAGGGGCGGCGGRPGQGGSGAGASVGILAIGGTLTFTDSRIRTEDAGAGGMGAPGGPGAGTGGAAGRSDGIACAGGKGGDAGEGGAGAGGAGGLSLGIFYDATALNGVDSTSASIQVGMPGASGRGGAPGNNDGPAGRAEKVLDYARLNEGL